jgi:peptidoglycan hydrolase CwlO-like protein
VSFIERIESVESFEDFISSGFDGLTSQDSYVKPALKAGKKKLQQIQKELDSCQEMVEKYKKKVEDREDLKARVEVIIGKLEGLS